MRNAIVGMYLGVAVLISPFYSLLGEHSYMGYFYNLGGALVWPVSLFKSYPEIDGSSAYAFMKSYSEVERSGKPRGYVDFYESVGYVMLYHVAEMDESVNRGYVDKLERSPSEFRNFVLTFIKNPDLSYAVIDELDGMTFGDIVREKTDWKEDLDELLEGREEAVRGVQERGEGIVFDSSRPESIYAVANGISDQDYRERFLAMFEYYKKPFYVNGIKSEADIDLLDGKTAKEMMQVLSEHSDMVDYHSQH